MLFTVTKADGNWQKGAFLFLDGCKVVDDRNWECTTPLSGAADAHGSIRYRMLNGQFSRSYLYGDFSSYSSGISGWRYWAVYLGLITPERAVKL